jgi:hypothetical protein
VEAAVAAGGGVYVNAITKDEKWFWKLEHPRPFIFSLIQEHLFYYNPLHVYLASIAVPDKLESQSQPSHHNTSIFLQT